MWQDIVVAIANIMFSYSLIHQVYHGFIEKKGFLTIPTSLLTTIGMFAITVVYLSLNLYISTIIGAFNGTMWFLLLIQRIIYKKA